MRKRRRRRVKREKEQIRGNRSEREGVERGKGTKEEEA